MIVRTIVIEDYLLFSSFSYIGGRLDCKDCMYTTSKYSKELSVCIFLISLSGIKFGKDHVNFGVSCLLFA